MKMWKSELNEIDVLGTRQETHAIMVGIRILISLNLK